MSLLISAGVATIAIVLMVLLENWGNIQRRRDEKWEEKCNRRKIII